MSTVWCITPYFNPAGYRTRLQNYRVFAESLERQRVPLLTVELALENEPFQLPDRDSIIPVRGNSRLWMKERLINVGISRLPPACERFAWLDCDLIFPDEDWLERLDSLFQMFDIVQLFERVTHLPPGHRTYQGEHLGSDTGVVAQSRATPDWLTLRRTGQMPFGVPGYGWAARRSLFAGLGLYDRLILGNGDAFLVDCLFDSFGIHHYSSQRTDAMVSDMESWRQQFLSDRQIRVGCLPIEIYHLWHGRFQDRGYCTRDGILRRHAYDPRRDIALKSDVYEWSSNKQALHEEVTAYFSTRLEDGN
jgi:hypothetical protein